ncbi:hypothetical protein BBK14_11330 [Parafrankia soli]|uniref:Uncharacterized protein n=1 Tax=Parafrankia soli TaxID=2599596 RepID=A0A1S1R8F7_9ACTN|nr:hypothetical protein [Parafrankia soli]OHV42206.1 hypothetical protein BBK14_11330 [Parafrankia soli]
MTTPTLTRPRTAEDRADDCLDEVTRLRAAHTHACQDAAAYAAERDDLRRRLDAAQSLARRWEDLARLHAARPTLWARTRRALDRVGTAAGIALGALAVVVGIAARSGT